MKVKKVYEWPLPEETPNERPSPYDLSSSTAPYETPSGRHAAFGFVLWALVIGLTVLAFAWPAKSQEMVARADFTLVIEDERTLSLRCFATVPSINWRQSWCFTRGPSPEVHGFIDLEAPAGIAPLEMTVVCFAFSALGCNGWMSGPSEQLVAVATEF